MLKRVFLNAVVICLMQGIVGCGPRNTEQTPMVKSDAAASTKETLSSAALLDPSTAGSVSGRVLLEGQAPPRQAVPIKGNPECAAFHEGGQVISEEIVANDGALQNVFVYVKEGLEGRTFEAPAQPVTISNKRCVYVPHVSGVQVGQAVQLLNEDPTLHNMHSYSKHNKPWNLGLPFQGMKQMKKFEAPEIMVGLKCDVHPWMNGYIGVLPHPYFSVTGASGEFQLKNLPPGEYLIEAWHEKLGAQSQKVTIGPQETKEIEFRFS